jgi:hypothetical protein
LTSPFALVLALLGAGCIALTSAGPVGPLRSGTTTQAEVAWGFAYGPATATVSGRTVTGNGEMQAAGGDSTQIPNIAPVRIGVRQSLGDMAEASADVGWVDSGLRLRVGMPDGSVPWAIAFEARDGQVSAFPVGSYHVSGALEIYPDITPADSHPPRRLILSVGIAGGVFEHQLSLPTAFDPDFDLPFGGPKMTVLRPEVRLQTAVGLYLGGKSDGLSIVVAPWFLLRGDTPRGSCQGCNPILGAPTFSLTSYSQGWGASLIITPAFGWLHGG